MLNGGFYILKVIYLGGYYTSIKFAKKHACFEYGRRSENRILIKATTFINNRQDN
jgi:hypothetical protein